MKNKEAVKKSKVIVLKEPVKKVKEKTATKKIKDDKPEKIFDVVETAANTFKTGFRTLVDDIQKAVPKEFKISVPVTLQLTSEDIPHVLHLEVPHYTPTLYWVEIMDVKITWNLTPSGKVSKAQELKFTLI